MKKLIGVIGSGLIGSDPFHERAWSGSSRFFFDALDKKNMLRRAFGSEAPFLKRCFYIIKNFSLDKELWRQKYYLDTGYYNCLKNTLCNFIEDDDFNNDFIQLGGIYDIPNFVSGRTRCFSYHDGNLAQLLKSPYMPNGINSKKIDKALEYEKNVYSGMNMIFTMSEYLKKSFVNDFGISENKVKCIGAGINIEKIPRAINKKYDLKNILFVGIRFERKGGYLLLEAFKKVRSKYPEAKLNIVGPRSLNIPFELNKNVEYHGFLSKNNPIENNKLAKLYENSVLFVMPSLYEPFGIAPLEAMANQIPCVLSDQWAFPEMVSPGKEGELSKCNDIDDLADKIIYLLSDTARLEVMGSNARSKVLNNYMWEVTVENLRKEIAGFN